MTFSISIPAETELALRERAASVGEDLPTYVSRLVASLAARPVPLEELSGPIYQNFLASGVSDDQLGDLVEEAKHAMRAERRARQL
jgi:hypothetical protein